MHKVIYSFSVGKNTVMKLDKPRPFKFTMYEIDGILYNPITIYDAPNCICIEAKGDFVGKTVKFVNTFTDEEWDALLDKL